MADNNKKIIYTVEINDKGKIKVENLTKGFVKMDNAVKKLNLDLEKTAAATSKVAASQGNMITTSGLAGATLTEFGRTISDANYGIRGVANNLSQLSSLFITLIAKAGSFTKAIEVLKIQLMGPLGLILVFQTLVMLLERFDMQSSKTKEAVDDIGSAGASAGSNLQILRDVMDDASLSTEELKRAVNKANLEYKDLNIEIDENGRVTEESRKQIDLKILSLMRLAKASAIQKEVERLFTEIVKSQVQESKALQAEEDKRQSLEQTRTAARNKALQTGVSISIEATETIIQRNKEAVSKGFKEQRDLLDKELKLLTDILTNEDLVDELFNPRESGSGGKVKRQLLKVAKEFKTIRDVFYQDIELDGEIRAVKTFKEVYKDALKELGVIAVKPAQDSMEALGREYKRVVKMNQDSLKAGLEAIKEDAKAVSGVFKATQRSLGQVNTVVMSYHNARMESLKREREYTLHSGKLTEGQKRVAIRDIERREIAAQKRKIKAERDMFTVKQSLLIAEEIMKFKFEVAERTRKLTDKTAEMTTEGIVQVGKAQMSAGAFAAQGGPIGLATFAVTIGGLIASILAARKKAKAQLSSLGAPSRGGAGDSGGTSFIAPDFNIVGSSATSQLSQTIADSEKSPLKAYVVTDDINNAQEFDRKVNAQASLG